MSGILGIKAKNSTLCHARENGQSPVVTWIPACAGMTVLKLRLLTAP